MEDLARVPSEWLSKVPKEMAQVAADLAVGVELGMVPGCYALK